MPLTQQEAAAALEDITRTERRTVSLLGYQMAWPHLVLWGVVWVIGYGAMAADVRWNYLWPALALAGSIGSFRIGYVMSRGRSKTMDWRYYATFFAVIFFISALLAIAPLKTNAQFGAFSPILVSLYYALVGIWTRGLRMIVLSVALVALTLFGFFHVQQHFELWMAIVGGGGLILGGLWLRSA